MSGGIYTKRKNWTGIYNFITNRVGRVSRLSKLPKLLKRSSEENGFGSQREVIKYLHDEFAVCYTQPGICLLFQRLKIKAKEPRPENKKADKEAQMEYKKTLLPG
ncbi:MAG: helix-turn-helix domain-containing protein [Pyrinomonadaceae bacterium]